MRLDFRRFLTEAGDMVVLGPLDDPELERWKADLLRSLRDGVLRAESGDQPHVVVDKLRTAVYNAPPRPQAASLSHAINRFIVAIEDGGRSREGRATLLKQAIALVHRTLRGRPQARFVNR
jgi:hypothetical protein